MVMGEARALAVGILIFSLGLLQIALGTLAVATTPEQVQVMAFGAVKLLSGLVLLLTAREIAALRQRGIGLAIIGFPGVVIAHAVPLVMGARLTLSVASVLLALSLLLYLFLHEDALSPESERELTEETNPHEFIR